MDFITGLAVGFLAGGIAFDLAWRYVNRLRDEDDAIRADHPATQ